MKAKDILIALGCLVVIAASALWTWRTQFAAPKFNVALHSGLGQALAEETARALNNTGKVVVVTLAPKMFPELGVQVHEFKKVLARHPGMEIKQSYELETDNKPKFNFGSGLSGRRYVRIVNKNVSAAAIVSFVGAPDLTDKEVAELKASPKLIAECRSADKLKRLFDLKVIHTAIAGRFEYPTPIKGTPHSPHEWVQQRFQVVTAENAAALPSGGNDLPVAAKK